MPYGKVLIVDDVAMNIKSSGIFEMVYKDFGESQKDAALEIRAAAEAKDFKTAVTWPTP